MKLLTTFGNRSFSCQTHAVPLRGKFSRMLSSSRAANPWLFGGGSHSRTPWTHNGFPLLNLFSSDRYNQRPGSLTSPCTACLQDSWPHCHGCRGRLRSASRHFLWQHQQSLGRLCPGRTLIYHAHPAPGDIPVNKSINQFIFLFVKFTNGFRIIACHMFWLMSFH